MLKIQDVNLKVSHTWGEIKGLTNWNALKGSWLQIRQTTYTGYPIFISVDVASMDWEYILMLNEDWQDIKSNYANWNGVKNI